MLGAMGDREIKQGMGVLLELTRGLAVLKENPASPETACVVAMMDILFST